MLVGQIVGRLGRDPQQKNVGSSAVTECSVAVSRRVNGDTVTEWVSLEVWGKSGAALGQHARKGDSIFAAGEISLERWQGRDGQGKSKLKMRCDRWEFAGSKRHESDRVTTPQESEPDEEIHF